MMRVFFLSLLFISILSPAQSIYLGDFCVDPDTSSLCSDSMSLDSSLSTIYIGALPLTLTQFLELDFDKEELKVDSSFIDCSEGSLLLAMHCSLNIPLYVNGERIKNVDEVEYILAVLDPKDITKIKHVNIPIAGKRYLEIWY